MKQQDEELEREKMRERSLSASKRVQVREGAFRGGGGDAIRGIP